MEHTFLQTWSLDVMSIVLVLVCVTLTAFLNGLGKKLGEHTGDYIAGKKNENIPTVIDGFLTVSTVLMLFALLFPLTILLFWCKVGATPTL
jgi:hypothetical protein